MLLYDSSEFIFNKLYHIILYITLINIYKNAKPNQCQQNTLLLLQAGTEETFLQNQRLKPRANFHRISQSVPSKYSRSIPHHSQGETSTIYNP